MGPLLVERRAQLGPVVEWVGADTWPPAWAEPLGLLGQHNLVNAGIARACLAAMGIPGADDEDALRAAAGGFDALESRLETVASLGGVDFVDDGLSTNVLSTLAAVDAFPGRRLALVAGGLDRNIDYAPLAEGLARRPATTLVLTTYTTGPTIQREVERHAGPNLTAVPCADLHEAVRVGAEWAGPDGVVLLSPAAASFDAFDDYRHKGRAFREAVAALPT
jgi:UDP-N-acetylmuramoylalanine--D-glutamate ligase